MDDNKLGTNHYFNRNPQVVSAVRRFETTVREKTFRFDTDRGVFSKNELDFGSRLLIEQAVIPPAARILDLGCGYGAVGICVAASHPDSRITMIDINERAIELARSNAKLNGVSEQVAVHQGDGLSGWTGDPWDIVLLNPPIRAGKQIVFQLYDQVRDLLTERGQLWVVIRKQQGAASSATYLESNYQIVNQVMVKKGFVLLVAEI